jgi:hypothetical protein
MTLVYLGLIRSGIYKTSMNNIFGHQPVADVIETVRFIGHRLSIDSGLDQQRKPCGGSEQQINQPSRYWTVQ